jgi:hypothetical protein
VRYRTFRESEEWQTAQLQPIIGTPCEVPVPMKLKIICGIFHGFRLKIQAKSPVG